MTETNSPEILNDWSLELICNLVLGIWSFAEHKKFDVVDSTMSFFTNT